MLLCNKISKSLEMEDEMIVWLHALTNTHVIVEG